MENKTILFVYGNYNSFVAKDEHILKQKYRVISFGFSNQKNLLLMLLELLKQFIFLLKNIWSVDVVFSWFSDFYSLLPFAFAKLLGKKTIVVVGGFDAVSIPHLKYGLFYKRNARQIFGVYSYRLSDYILPVDRSLVKSTNFFFDKKGLQVGVENYMPELKAKIKVIPTGYNPELWVSKGLSRTNSVVAFAYAPNMQKYIGKGHEFLVKVAKKMPDISFTIIGVTDNLVPMIQNSLPPNVIIKGRLTQEELLEELSVHKVYALFSMSEGMPSSLCEAMLCECIPVGSNVGGVKDIINNCGLVLNHQDIDQAVELLTKALSTDPRSFKNGRKRIVEKFSINYRMTELFNIIDSL